MELKVLKPLRDKNNPEVVYKVGEVFECNDVERINDLVKRGLCRIESIESIEGVEGGGKCNFIELSGGSFDAKAVKVALKAIGQGTSWNATNETVVSKVNELSPELKQSLLELLTEKQ